VRVAIVDIGSNSTRLLIADVDAAAGTVTELLRRSEVTRLGDGVDSAGNLSEVAAARVFARLEEYRGAIEAHHCETNMAVLTSAVRDARNGAAFAERVVADYGLHAHVLSGDEEAQLTFLGAMAGRPEPTDPLVVIDIGGGSTEFVVGVGRAARFHVSLPVGVVRMSERHISSDPPRPHELQALAEDVWETLLTGVPARERAAVRAGVAVAGTATSAASIDQELDPYDPERVHGYRLELGTIELLLARLADMDEAHRRQVVGLNPDRAPTIVAGMIIFSEALRAFDLERVEISEHDILYGGALRAAQARLERRG
jgi:exopolyphosphatase / guanosine-5'-triphosphate,3'-diphosphate pyrophosphatase